MFHDVESDLQRRLEAARQRVAELEAAVRDGEPDAERTAMLHQARQAVARLEEALAYARAHRPAG